MGKKKFIILAAILVVVAGSAFFTVRFLKINELRKQLPSLTELSIATPELEEQITSSYEKALNDPSSINIGQLGMVFYSSYYYEEATSCFELAARETLAQWQWNYYLGLLKMELGQSEEAMLLMKRVINLDPGVNLAWYRLGEIYQQMDSTRLAEETLLKISGLSEKETQIKQTMRSVYFPLQLYAKVLLAKIYVSEGRVEEAENELLDVRYKYLNFGPAFRQLEVFYSQQGNTEKSNYYRNRANDLVVNNSPVDTLQDRLALISRSEPFVTKQIDVANYGTDTRWTFELIDHALKNIPHNKFILSKAVNQYAQMGLGKLVLPLLDEHFSFFKDSYRELQKTGTNLADAGFRDAAIMYFEQALTFTNQDAESKANLAGLLFEKVGLKDKAVQVMREVLADNPNNETVLGDAVFLFFHTDQQEDVRRCNAQLRRINPSNPKIKIFDGMMAERNGQQLKAISLFEQAFDADPKNRVVIQYLTNAYYQKQLWKEAIAFFRKALESYPNDSGIQMQLGLLLVTCPDAKLRNLEKGKDLSERSFYNSRYLINDRISAGRTLAIASYMLGKKRNAIFYINETIQLALKAKVQDSYVQDLRRLQQRYSAGEPVRN